MEKKKTRSGRNELISKSQEAALSAIQIYNSPTYFFKSETFSVLIIIAWTYLLHAYYKGKDVDYRYYKLVNNRKKYYKTKYGAFKRWELETCLKSEKCPLDKDTKNNLEFIIQLRHEIEHQMTNRIDDTLSARFQACIINYNNYIKQLFGDKYGLDKYINVSLQLSGIEDEQKSMLLSETTLPKYLKAFVTDFDNSLSDEEFNSLAYAYRVFYTPKLVNHRQQADKVIEFIKPDSELAQTLKTQYVVLKEREKAKYLPGQIVEIVKTEYPKFNMRDFVQLWKSNDAKNPKYNYGTIVANKTWHWYENWLKFVLEYCQKHSELYR